MSTVGNVGQAAPLQQVQQAIAPRTTSGDQSSQTSTGNTPATKVTISAAAQQLSKAAGDQDHDGDSK